MTDEFISDKTSEQNTGDQQGGDNQTGKGEGVDTKSVEYQLQQLQKRVDDKDAYIQQLESEGKTFREALDQYEERLKTTEELTKLLEQSGNQAQSGGSNQETALDENTVAEKVIETLSKREAEDQMNKNWAEVESRVKQTFGEDANSINEKMRQIAQENGMSVSDMKETARKSPKAFYKLAGIESGSQQRVQSPQPSRGSVQGVDYETSNKDLAYYNNLMRTNWREYMKPENQRAYRKLLLEQSNQS